MSDAVPYANYQYEIYLRGMANQRPARTLDWRQLEQDAYNLLRRGPRGYIAGGAGLGRDDARQPRGLRPLAHPAAHAARRLRALAGVARCWEPSCPRRCCWRRSACRRWRTPRASWRWRAARRAAGVPLVASSAASHTIEQIAQAAGELTRWYQLYWPRDRELARSFVERAERAGYGAIVVTLDTWLLGWRPADLSEAFLPFLWGEGNRNYLEDPVFRGLLEVPPEEDMQAAIGQWAWQFANPSVTWEDLAFLRECTELPIVLKGILHPDDARLAVEHGVQGVLVSNHGGRQVDGAVGALDALPGVVRAVDGRSEVLFDSGIRSGADALKALALGARAVLLGRPYVWGLALGGEEGVVEVLRSFLGDLDLAMALSGYANIDEVDASALVRKEI